MPRTFGDSVIHFSHIDVLVEEHLILPERQIETMNDDDNRIGDIIAKNLVDDGATLQMGKFSNFNGKYSNPRCWWDLRRVSSRPS